MDETPPVQLPVSPQETQIPSVISLPDKPKTPFFKMIIFLFLGLILISGLVFAGYKMEDKRIASLPTPTPIISPSPTPTPDPTAGWKTFMDSKLGFVLK